MQLKKAEFERMTWGEFECMYAGYFRNKESQLAQTRLIMWAALAGKSKRKIKPEDLISLASDKKKKKPQSLMSKDKFNELKQRWYVNCSSN